MVSRREKGGEGISLEIRGLRKHFEFWLVKHVNVLYTLKIKLKVKEKTNLKGKMKQKLVRREFKLHI